ncbi:MAG: AraC family transcriptional regulator [Gemmobacter sp.]
MTDPTERRVLRVLDHIYDHPDGDLSLDALAEVAALSRFHWHRLFRAVTGETAAQAVRRIRLHRASVALVQTAVPVDRVALSVGYDSTDSFVRAFRDSYGMTPLAFRKRGELRPFNTTKPPRRTLMFPVTRRDDPARRLAAMPHKGPYAEIGRTFQKLSAIMTTRGLFAHVGGIVAVYYDDIAATAPDDLRSHAGFQISRGTVIEAPIEVVDLPASRAAVLTFTGPYAGLAAAWDALYGVWLPASGETPADLAPFEVYLNSPMDTAPDALVTEIHLPLMG